MQACLQPASQFGAFRLCKGTHRDMEDSCPSLCLLLAQMLTGPACAVLAQGAICDRQHEVSIPIWEQQSAVSSSKGHFGDIRCWGIWGLGPVPSYHPWHGRKKWEASQGEERLYAPKLATRAGWFSCLLPKWKMGRH